MPQAPALRSTAAELPRDTRADPVAAAARAGLRYVHDRQPGIQRRRSGKAFSYLSSQNKVIRDEATLGRIRALVIPPAWTDVWICEHENGHIQATGRDAKGRKQYRYHPKYRENRKTLKSEPV